MHELSLIENVIKIVEKLARQEKLTTVTKVYLQVGALRQIVPEFMQFAFISAAVGTIMSRASLKVEVIPIKICCENCNHEFTVEELVYLCPKCEHAALKIVAGKEIVIESIEGEQDKLL
jgi:hydrogenase nickel incorporation protein HypA/HybF